VEFSQAMIAGGLKCHVEEQIRDEMWVKLMGNAVFNPLSVLTGATLGAMCRHPGTRKLAATMMAEALAIALPTGARPSVSIERRLTGAERVGEHKTSTLQDLEAGKPLELAAIIDAVVELADLTGIDAPAMRTVAAACSLLAETRERDKTQAGGGAPPSPS
jgi:2-dehydropantoate 2-reductase